MGAVVHDYCRKAWVSWETSQINQSALAATASRATTPPYLRVQTFKGVRMGLVA
jgi:hypothetical protein